MNDEFYINDNAFYINDYSLAVEAYKLTVKNSKDVLKDEKIKQRLVKLSKLAEKNGWENVTPSTDFTKFNTKRMDYSLLNSSKACVFSDPDTKITMMRYCPSKNMSSHIYSRAIKQFTKKKVTFKNQSTYYIKAMFVDTKHKNKLIFKTVCEIYIKK